MFICFLSRWLPFATWGGIIIWLSLTPAPPTIDNPLFGWDKLQHALAYAPLTLLAFRAFGTITVHTQRRWWKAVAVTLILGGFLEIAQGLFTRTRTAEFGDLLADLIGAGIAYLAVRIYLLITAGENNDRS